MELTRRSLIAGGIGVGAASLGSYAGIACADEGERAFWLPESWDMEADLVVLGAGVAGIMGALEADKLGVSCILLEKEPPETAGGDTRCNGGYLGKLCWGPNNLIQGSFGYMSEEWAYAVEDEMVDEIFPDLDDLDMPWDGDSRETDMPHVQGHGAAFYKTIVENGLEKSGVQVYYGTPAQKLIVNPQTGEVIGVYACQDGKTIAVKANKGVLVATGGYTANAELIEHFNLVGVKPYTDSTPANTGDGLIMAASIGAAIGHLPKSIDFTGYVAKVATEEMGTGIAVASNPAHGSRIFVGYQGNRFMNELKMPSHTFGDTDAILSYATPAPKTPSVYGPDDFMNLPAFAVFDQACLESDCMGNKWRDGTTWANAVLNFVWSDDNQEELSKGWITKADTLEELAETMGIDAAGLVATVDNWNAMCEAGVDTEFGRSDATLMAFGDGPFYAIEIAPCLHYTKGGLMTDQQSHTLNWMHEPIPRLYSAGNVGQNSFTFPVGMGPHMAQARWAVREVATLTAWDAE